MADTLVARIEFGKETPFLSPPGWRTQPSPSRYGASEDPEPILTNHSPARDGCHDQCPDEWIRVLLVEGCKDEVGELPHSHCVGCGAIRLDL